MRRSRRALTLVVLAACGTGPGTELTAPSASEAPTSGRADVGGYELAYECLGEGEPTVVFEAGLGAAGTSEFSGFLPRVAEISRVCTYDRAGTGESDERPAGGDTVTAGLMADELHRLLDALSIEPPYVLVGHSYGGMPVRAFAGAHPDEVAGMVLLDVSSEPEVPIYERLDAGPWIDDTDRIDIHATVRELRAAGDVGDIPLVVLTAGIIEDEWLATVPGLAARAQSRLASLSSNAIHVVAASSGHFVHDDEPAIVEAAIAAVVEAARTRDPLASCADVFGMAGAACMERGEVPQLVPA